MKRKLVCICLSMAVFGTLLSGCGEGKSEKVSGGSGQADVDVESYDFSQDKSFDITAGGIQAAEDTVTLAMQKMADEGRKNPVEPLPSLYLRRRSLEMRRVRWRQYPWEPRRCSWMPVPGFPHLWMMPR